MAQPGEQSNVRTVVKGLVFLATLVAIGFIIKATGLKGLLDTAWIDNEVKGQGVQGEILFVVVAAFFTGVGMPRQIVSFLGGYAFGFAAGTALGLIGTVGGCVASFYYARFLGRSAVRSRFAKRIDRADRFLKENPFSLALIIRLLPFGSNIVTNLVAGVSSASGLRFIAGSALGFIPQTAIAALVGSGIDVDPVLRLTLGAGLFIISGALGIYLFRRSREARAMSSDNGNGNGDSDTDAA